MVNEGIGNNPLRRKLEIESRDLGEDPTAVANMSNVDFRKVQRASDGSTRELPAQCRDYSEPNGATYDKLNIEKINVGYAGMKTYKDPYSAVRKKILDQRTPVDYFHNV